MISFVHQMMRLPIKEPARTKAALAHLEAAVAQAKEMWKYILAETDDDNEWIPNPRQTGVMGVKVTQEMVDAWLETLDEADQILKGKKLIPFWRGKEDGRGVNLRRVFTEPRTFDAIEWVQGTAATPYLEKGPLTKLADPRMGDRLNKAFGGPFKLHRLRLLVQLSACGQGRGRGSCISNPPALHVLLALRPVRLDAENRPRRRPYSIDPAECGLGFPLGRPSAWVASIPAEPRQERRPTARRPQRGMMRKKQTAPTRRRTYRRAASQRPGSVGRLRGLRHGRVSEKATHECHACPIERQDGGVSFFIPHSEWAGTRQSRRPRRRR